MKTSNFAWFQKGIYQIKNLSKAFDSRNMRFYVLQERVVGIGNDCDYIEALFSGLSFYN